MPSWWAIADLQGRTSLARGARDSVALPCYVDVVQQQQQTTVADSLLAVGDAVFAAVDAAPIRRVVLRTAQLGALIGVASVLVPSLVTWVLWLIPACALAYRLDGSSAPRALRWPPAGMLAGMIVAAAGCVPAYAATYVARELFFAALTWLP